MTPLQKAAQAVIDRWNSPSWKDQPHTAEYINELRKALEAEIAQAVEPLAWIERDMQCDDFDPDSVTCLRPVIAADGWEWAPLYLHPPQPQATTAVPCGLIEILYEASKFIEAVNQGLEPKTRYPMADELHGYAAMLKAAQGEKP